MTRPTAAAALDAEFHEQLVLLSGYPRLHRMWRSMRDQFSLAIRALDVPHQTNEETAREHEPILAALRARDVAVAEKAVTEHIRKGLRVGFRGVAAEIVLADSQAPRATTSVPCRTTG